MTQIFSFFPSCVLWIVRPVLRQRALVITLVGLALSNAWITERPSHDYVYYALVAWMDIYLAAAFVELSGQITKSGKWKFLHQFVKIMVYITAYMLWSVEIFLFERFHLCISPTVIHLLLETTPAESGEFLEGLLSNDIFWQVFIATLSLVFTSLLLEFCHLISFRGRGLCRKLTFGFLGKSVFGALVMAVFVGAFGAWCNHQFKMLQFFCNSQSDHAETVAESEFFTPYYRSVQAIHLVRMAADETEALKARMQHLPVLKVADKSCPNIVVIIGESYNKHHAALYGYGLPTTPRLCERAKRGELVVFDNVISPWNITSNAFRAFLSTQSADDGGRWTEGVLFPALFKRAGFKVAFLSNQFFHTVSQGSIDFNGSFFLNDSEMENLCFDHRNVFRSKNDGTILSLLKGFTPGERNLYLFHLWGQHMEYDHRYPSEQTTFTHHDIQRRDLTQSQ